MKTAFIFNGKGKLEIAVSPDRQTSVVKRIESENEFSVRICTPDEHTIDYNQYIMTRLKIKKKNIYGKYDNVASTGDILRNYQLSH